MARTLGGMTLDYVGHLRSDTARFLAVLREADPTLRVPSCPDWDAADLLWHLGEVQWFWATIVGRRLQDPEAAEGDKPPRPASQRGLVAFLEDVNEHLVEALSTADPAERVWMWAEDKTVGYVRRRQANEAMIHRLDAELTVGDVTSLDPLLSADALEEVFSTMYGGVPGWGTFTPSGRSVLLAPTDVAAPLHLRLGRFTGTSPSSGTTYDDPACEVVPTSTAPSATVPSATVQGSAADLTAWAWSRADTRPLTMTGDPKAVSELSALVDLGVQ